LFKKIIGMAAAAATVAVVLAGCGSSSDTETTDAATGGLIGVSMPTQSSTRWISDGESIQSALEADGFEVDLQYAEDDIPTQVSQLEAMLTKGAKALIIAAIDGTQLTDVLQSAADKGVPVIAYDRLIRDSANVDYYASFDNFKVGVLQATSLLVGMGVYASEDSTEADGPNAKGPLNVELFAGSPDDNNATFFFNGAMSVLQPLIDSKVLVVKSGQTKFEQVAILRWDGAVAQKRMEDILVGTYAKGAKVNGVLSPYDGLSRGIIAALTDGGYTAKDLPTISGQDAEVLSVKSMIAGEFGEKREIRGGFNIGGRNRHQADQVEARTSGIGYKLRQVMDRATTFLRFIPAIDLNETGRVPSGLGLSLGKRQDQRFAIDRVYDIEQCDCIIRLVRLKLPDQMKFDVGEFGSQGRPFSLGLLNTIFAEALVPSFEQRTNRGSVVGFRDSDQFDIIGMSAREFRRACDICFHAGQPVLCVFVHPAAIGR